MISASTSARAISVTALMLIAACASKSNPPLESPDGVTAKTTASEGSTAATSGSTAATSSSTAATQRRPSVDEAVPASKPGGTQPVSTEVATTAQPAPPVAMAMSSAPISQDPALVKTGEKVFKSKSCSTCHTVGKGRMAGPDLAGVTTRREAAWLRTWLHDPPAMIASGDATAVALLAEYKGVKMPNMKLTDADIDALVAYLGAHPAK